MNGGLLETAIGDADKGTATGRLSMLRSWWFRATVVAILALGSLVVWGITVEAQRQHDQARARAFNIVEAVLKLKSAEISRWAADRRDHTAAMSDDLALVDFASAVATGDADPRLRSAALLELRHESRNYGVTSLIVDARGRVLLASVSQSPVLDAQEREGVAQALRGDTTLFVDIHLDAQGRLTMAYVAPIATVHKTGHRDAALVTRIDPRQFFFDFVQTWPGDEATGESLLVERRGNDVVFLSALRFDAQRPPLSLRLPMSDQSLPAARAAAGETGFGGMRDYRRADVLAAWSPVAGTPWSLVVKMDHAEAERGARHDMVAIYLIVGAVSAALMLAAALAWRWRAGRAVRRLYEDEIARRALGVHYEALTRYANDIIMLFDASLTVLDANQRARRLRLFHRGALDPAAGADLDSV